MDGIRKARYEHSRLAYMRHPAVAITEVPPRPMSRRTQIPAMRMDGVQARAS